MFVTGGALTVTLQLADVLFELTVTVLVPVLLYVVENVAPVPDAGEPPDADQEYVPFPPDALKDAV